MKFVKFEGDKTYYTETVTSPSNWEGASEHPIFKKGVTQWEPGQTFTVLLGSASRAAYERAAEKPWIFHVEYENQSGKKICQTLDWISPL